jgi:Flp pilus assembly protein TadD
MGESRIKAGNDDPEHRTERYKEARPWLGRAYKRDPTSYETLYAFAISKQVDADFPSENTLNTLLEARRLAPQVPEIVIATADALRLRHHEKDARTILTPLANDPHQPGAAAQAKKLLDKINGVPEPAKDAAQAAPAK